MFGEEFQSKLTSMVERDTALAKAVSITKRHKKEKNSLPIKKTGPRLSVFFERAPLASTGTGGARIFNRTHSTQVKTGTPSEVPICRTTRQATSSTTDQAKNHSSTSHDCLHPHLSKNPNRESTRSATLPSPDSAPKSGNISRRGYRKAGSSAPCGSQTSTFPPKLASHNRRPLDPKYNKGIQFGTNIHTRAASPTATSSPQPGKVSSAHCRDRQTVAETCNQSSRSLSRRISEPNFPSSQGRWVLAPSNQSSGSQLTHCPAPLQNGGDQDSEGAYEKRRLANEAGSEGCPSFSANESGTHTHLLRFQWQNQTYQFDTLPFGLSSAPYIFTKLLKLVEAILRRLGIRVVLYLDDMLIMASSKEEARAHLATAIHLLTALGFILNLDKSVLTSTQRVIFLGFCPDSRTMLISLPIPKIQSIQRLIREILPQGQATILKLSQLLGSMISTHPAVLAAPLHYCHLERAKITALRHSHNYNTVVTISDNMRQDLTWWLQELPRHNGRSMQIMQWDMVIESDASMLGWGANLNNTSTGGPWAPHERSHHINYLKLLAAFLALKTFATNTHNKAILLTLDNVTAIAFLNRMGGRIQRHFAIWRCMLGNGAWRGIYSSMQNTSPGS